MQTNATNKEDVQLTGGQTLSMFNENKKNIGIFEIIAAN